MQFFAIKNGSSSNQKYTCRIKYSGILSARPFIWLIVFSLISPSSIAQKPELFLLHTYQESQDVIGWVMSEKLDGVRAYWNGKQLISRGGNVFNAPKWFLQNFPPFALDGELWTKRNDFENIVSIVRRQQPDERWSQITYQVFEVPDQSGGLFERLSVLQTYLNFVTNRLIPIVKIPQLKIKNKMHVNDFFQQVIGQGGEGLVVRDPFSQYQIGRLKTALKIKSHQDEDCEVTGYKPGRGKYMAMVGALKCQLRDQRIINIGSGLSDQQRKQPPAIGSIITFKYYGLTRNDLPRFPVFLRSRMLASEGK